MKTLNPAVARVLKRLHYPLDVVLTCVRWYVAYPQSLRHLEDMMAELRRFDRSCEGAPLVPSSLLPAQEKAFQLSFCLEIATRKTYWLTGSYERLPFCDRGDALVSEIGRASCRERV